MTLYQKHRPTDLDQIIGNNDTVKALKAIIRKQDPPHAYPFHGSSGCGKTTIARIIATELGCIGSDFREKNTADFRGIDTIREIIHQSQFKPIEGNFRGWLLDEVHMLTNEAQNALLKALEDAPKHVFYFLATTNPQKLLETIRSRCSQYQLSPLNELQMKKLLRDVVNAEGDSLDKQVYDQIILDSQGRPRDALNILEKTLSVESEDRLRIAQQAAKQQSKTIELCQAMLNGSPWKKISHILDGLRDEEPESVRRAVLGYCTTVLLRGENDRAGIVMDELKRPIYDSGFPGLVLACYTAFRQAD
jgi:DNA polymerase III gamma/tau subunit